ncbi:response regulator [Pseudomonas sp. PDM14]|uniref:hybrid sensor histidine kinase/response regulator n=1 Tax=Pseudomonas sp. PDM14 TaxID=2769288 RepID=UPI001785CD97|nr:hybrid sensor histidine kinase/response regulator [Pseudomonas sp. PDM14]MBD9481740.1 response regulator [Pseudomonas sp. PDM14]
MPLKPLKLLFVEDSPRDAELALLTLERNGLQVEPTLVYNHQGVEEALQHQQFDLILCDFILPGSSGSQALQVAQRIAPKTPLIFLSGVFGEEHAVDMMRLGAIDYVLKQNLQLLPKAVNRALAEVHERRRRLQAEEALLDVEVRARLALDAARMGMWDYQLDSGTLIWDERCKALYELPADSAIDVGTFLERCHPDDRPHVEHKMTEALAHDSGNEYQAEYRVVLPDGRERWVQASGRAFFEDDRCVRFIGVMQDVSEQKHTTAALQRLNELLGERVEKRTRERDRTWELSRELLAVMRFDMTPIALNPAWEDTLGRPRQLLSQDQLWHLVHPEDIEATRRETASVADGNVSTRFVNRMLHANGEYRWLSWTIVPDEGLMYAAVRDITSERAVVDELAATNQRLREQVTERKRVEATLEQMQRLEAVGQLTAGVAHDFNNLLTVILTSATFLERDFQRGSFERSLGRLQNIREAGERGAKLTGQLLSFSRRQRLEPVPVNLNDTLYGMIEMLQRTLGGAIWIETCTAPDLWRALVDPTQTEMIILNLAINARDAMSNGGALRLSTSNEVVERKPQRPEDPEPGPYVVLSIQDTGSGMSDEVLAKAFEPFFTTKEVGKGSGLGLAQVFGFAKQSGGGVSIVTERDRGTVVRVYLPCIRDAVPDASEPLYLSTRPAPSGPQKTILLVDDDANVRDVTAGLLDLLGYRVIEADSGQEALERIDEQVDLLLTDFAMPGMNGAQLAGAVAERFPELPVIFVTGYAELGGLDAEDRVIVQKPFRDDELANKLHAALEGARQRDA